MRKIYILSGGGQKGATEAEMHVSQCVCKVGVAISRFVCVYMRAIRGIICISQNFSLPLLAFLRGTYAREENKQKLNNNKQLTKTSYNAYNSTIS